MTADFVAGVGEGGVAGHDGAVVAVADPAALGVVAVGVHDEEHGALVADVVVGGGVPAHEDVVVPDAQFAAPEVVGDRLLGRELERFDADGLAELLEPDGLGGDDLSPRERLPGGPPGAVEPRLGDGSPASSAIESPSAAASWTATVSTGCCSSLS